MELVQHLINGLLQGAILALVGLGFSMVWGILKIINLAHAAFIMLAAYMTYFLWAALGVDPFITLPITMIIMFVVGYVMQKHVINLVMRSSPLTTFLLTFGIQTLIINLALRFWTADTRQSRPAYANGSFALGAVHIPYVQLAAFIVTLILALLLYLYLEHTKPGRAIHAVSMDTIAARLMGINIGRTYALTFALSAALAAACGTLLSATSGFSPTTFDIFNVIAFSVVVLGGLGSIPGTLLGGLVFGLVYEFASTYVLAQRDVVVFAILILVLILKPTGLLGKEGYR